MDNDKYTFPKKIKLITTKFIPFDIDAIIYSNDIVDKIKDEFNISVPIENIPMYLVNANTLLINEKMYSLLVKTNSITIDEVKKPKDEIIEIPKDEVVKKNSKDKVTKKPKDEIIEIPREEEYEECPICIERLNVINKFVCPSCFYTICKSCAKTYILGSIQDPTCMNCKKAFTNQFIYELLSSAFFNKEYKKHREEVLYQREKSLLPATMRFLKPITTGL